MFRLLFLLFVAIPILEIYLLIQVGDRVGPGYTILAVLATAVLGAWLVRREGLKTLLTLQERVARGELPAAEMVEGAMLLVAGTLLVTPGFVTDTIGFLLAFPLTRPLLRRVVMNALLGRVRVHSAPFGAWHTTMGGPADHPHHHTGHPHHHGAGHSAEGTVIEGDYRRNPENRDRE